MNLRRIALGAVGATALLGVTAGITTAVVTNEPADVTTEATPRVSATVSDSYLLGQELAQETRNSGVGGPGVFTRDDITAQQWCDEYVTTPYLLLLMGRPSPQPIDIDDLTAGCVAAGEAMIADYADSAVSVTARQMWESTPAEDRADLCAWLETSRSEAEASLASRSPLTAAEAVAVVATTSTTYCS